MELNKIYKEAIGYIKYKQDVSTLAVPLPHGTNTSSKGNTMELKPFV